MTRSASSRAILLSKAILLPFLLLPFFLGGCSLHGVRTVQGTEEIENTQPGTSRYEVQAAVTGTSLMVDVQEIVPYTRTVSEKTTYAWKSGSYPDWIALSDCFYLLGEMIDMFGSPIYAFTLLGKDDEEIRGGPLGVLAATLLPFVTCFGADDELSGDVYRTEEKIELKRTDVDFREDRRPAQAQVLVQGPGGPLQAFTGSDGRAVFPLAPFAVAALKEAASQAQLMIGANGGHADVTVGFDTLLRAAHGQEH